MEKFLSSAKGQYLQTIGGHYWHEGDIYRLYFDGAKVAHMCGVLIFTPFQATCPEVLVDGKLIEDVNERYKIANYFANIKFYYDIPSGKFFCKGHGKLPKSYKERLIALQKNMNTYIQEKF